MQYLKILASFWNKIANIFFYCPSITHKDEHFANTIGWISLLTINDRYNLQNENKESVKSKIDCLH
jgi:hypothetical protein